ncbi:MAG TPA: hypothetical protein VKI61_06890 [Chitinophagaceae bacterium]|nr:hypothetical protein [Chitinophagaceae bacterium]
MEKGTITKSKVCTSHGYFLFLSTSNIKPSKVKFKQVISLIRSGKETGPVSVPDFQKSPSMWRLYLKMYSEMLRNPIRKTIHAQAMAINLRCLFTKEILRR